MGHKLAFGHYMESDSHLEAVEAGTADTVEGKTVYDAPSWVPSPWALPGVHGVRMTRAELAALAREEAREEAEAIAIVLWREAHPGWVLIIPD